MPLRSLFQWIRAVLLFEGPRQPGLFTGNVPLLLRRLGLLEVVRMVHRSGFFSLLLALRCTKARGKLFGGVQICLLMLMDARFQSARQYDSIVASSPFVEVFDDARHSVWPTMRYCSGFAASCTLQWCVPKNTSKTKLSSRFTNVPCGGGYWVPESAESPKVRPWLLLVCGDL